VNVITQTVAVAVGVFVAPPGVLVTVREGVAVIVTVLLGVAVKVLVGVLVTALVAVGVRVGGQRPPL
jgi:hypothetical protein